MRLVGHGGGLTKAGGRPRFRVTGREALVFSLLREIDAALSPLDETPADWLRRPVRTGPLRGATPLDHMLSRGADGARGVLHEVAMASLRRSI